MSDFGVPGPPRLAVWLVCRVLDREPAAAVLGDLQEDLARLLGGGHWVWPAGWYVWHAARYTAALRLNRLRQPIDDPYRSGPDPWDGHRQGRNATLKAIAFDMRQAVRSILRSPRFAVPMVITLAAGIGLNAAMFSFVNRLLIKPLPYPDADRLVQLSETAPDLGTMDLSFPDYTAWRAGTRVFDAMAAFDDARFLLSQPEGPVRVEGAVVSSTLLSVLGLTPSRGRFFTASEESPGQDGVVVLSHSFWIERYGGEPGILGRTIVLNGRPRNVVGVGPPEFRFPEVADLWVPLALDPARADPEDYSFDAIARLAPGATIEAARREGERIVRQLAEQRRSADANIGVDVYALRRADVSAQLGWASVLLLGAVGAVLLIACLNLSVLVATRGMSRRGELAVRMAMGASRRRLVAHQLSETAVVTVAGVAGAIAIGTWLTGLLNAMLPVERPFWMVLEMDGVVLGFAAVVAVASVVVVGLVPALQTTSGGFDLRGATGLRRSLVRAQGAMVIAQVAVSFALLAGAGLLLDGLGRLRSERSIGGAGNVATITYEIPTAAAGDAAAQRALRERTLTVVRNVPGILHAGAASSLPVESAGDEVAFEIATGSDPGGPLPVARLYAISGGFLPALGIPIVAGREFDESRGGQVMVSEALAARFWPRGDAIGRRLRHGVPGTRSPTVADDAAVSEIVGIVSDVQPAGQPSVTEFVIYVQDRESPLSRATLVLRSTGDELSAATFARERLREIAPEAVIDPVRPLDRIVLESLTLQRLLSRLFSAFAIAAIGLAAVGIWAMAAYMVRLRRGELAIRRAVGARDLDLIGMLLARSAKVLLAGLAFGLSLAWALNQALRATVPGIETAGTGQSFATASIFILIAFVASYLPARRVLGISPREVLQSD